MNKNTNTQAAIARIRELLGGNSMEDCITAGDILMDLIAFGAADHCTAMSLCSMVFHGFCTLPEFPRMGDAERALADLWRAARHHLIDDRQIADGQKAQWLIDRLSSIQPDSRQAGCIARVRRDFMALPDESARMKVWLTLQSACAFAIVNWRGEGSSGRLMYEHLSRSIAEEDAAPDLFFHKADESQALRGKAAENLEQALFDAMARRFEAIDAPQAQSWTPSSGSDRAIVQGWDSMCSEATIKNYLDDYDATRIDDSGCFKYQCPVPGECVILECLPQGGQDAPEEYTVPAMIDGIRVRRVEHIPDIRCGILRFAEGIEEISLQGFHGEIGRLLLPDSLVRIEEGSFQGLPSLREVIMNGAVLESRAFAHCVNLERVRFGPKLWSIMDRAFEGCLRLKHVAFPDKVFSIGEEAFSGCAMEMLTLPEMAYLRDGAFRKCASLEAVGFTGEIENLDGDPFSGCDRLKRFVDVDKAKGLTFINGALIYSFEDTVSPIFSFSGKEETQVCRCVIHTVPHS